MELSWSSFWPPSENSNSFLLAFILIEISILYVWVLPPKKSKQTKKSEASKLNRLREGSVLILSEVQKADEKLAKEEKQPKWQEELPEPSRVFSFLWDETYDKPTTTWGISAEDENHKAMYALFDRVLRNHLNRTCAFTEQALLMALDAVDGSDYGGFGKAGEVTYKEWLEVNKANVGEVESFLSGEALSEAIDFADKAWKKLGIQAIQMETQASVAKCKAVRARLEKQNSMARRIIYGIALRVFPTLVGAIFFDSMGIMGWTEFDRFIFTDISSPVKVDGTYDMAIGKQLVFNLIIIICGVWWVSHTVGGHLLSKTQSDFCAKLKCRLMECAMYQDYEYFTKNSSTLQNRISTDVEKVGESLLEVPKDLAMAVIMITIKLSMCLRLAPTRICFYVLAPIPFLAFMNYKTMKFGNGEDEKGRRVAEQANSGIMDVIKNMKTVRFFANEAEELVRFRASVDLQTNITQKCSLIQRGGIHFFIFCITVSVGFAAYFAGDAVNNKEMDAKDISNFSINMLHQVHLWQNLFNQLPRLTKILEPINRIVLLLRSQSKIEPNPNLPNTAPVHQCVRTQKELDAALSNLETTDSQIVGERFATYIRVRSAFAVNGTAVPVGARLLGVQVTSEETDEIEYLPSVQDLKALALPSVLVYSRKLMPSRLKGAIKFDNVDWHHPSDLRTKVLDGMAWEVKPGEKVGICGTAGCGKSTCMELIMRLYNPDPTGGAILVDGIDIKRYDVHFLRQRICIVSQKTVLFKTTVRENLWYGLPTFPGDEVIQETCMKAQIWEDLQKKPDKLLTMIADDGGGFSGGQEQRLSIARVLLRQPDIILLDEATAALDPVNERLVQDSLDKLMRATSTTTLAIAHRLTTIKDSDRILVLNKGKLVEDGRHTELVKREIAKSEPDQEGNQQVTAGFYRNQWDTQFQENDTSVHRMREKIEELQYQVGMYQSKIVDAVQKNQTLWHKYDKATKGAETGPLQPLALLRHFSEGNAPTTAPAPNDDVVPPPPPLPVHRWRTTDCQTEENPGSGSEPISRLKLTRATTAHQQLFW